MQFRSLQPSQIILRLLILVEICREVTSLQQVEVVLIFMPYFRSIDCYAYCVCLLHKYEAHIKGLPICFSEVQVKNDVTDNNNKHFVTAFEGECRNIIELREHLKLCFLVILGIQIRCHRRIPIGPIRHNRILASLNLAKSSLSVTSLGDKHQ